MLKKFFHHEKGITGLETAIILIAFVVVAAVFAYTVLSAGLFSTQKGQEAVYSGLQEAQSTLELKGVVLGTANVTGDEDDSANVQQITFTVANVLGGEPVDFTPPEPSSSNNGTADDATSQNKVVINYVDQNQTVNDLYWTVSKLGNADDDELLEVNEKFEITIGSDTPNSNGGNLVDALAPDLGVNQTFSIVVLTPAGAVLEIERTTPPWFDKIMNLR
jgi:flagellin FlaB